MLIMFRGTMNKPYGMSDKEFYTVWLEEAKAALEAREMGILKDIWKVAGKPIVIGVIEAEDAQAFNDMLLDLPVYKKGYSYLNEMDYDVLTSYEAWANKMEDLVGAL